MAQIIETEYLEKNLLPQNVDLVIYHGKCCDGFGSALSAYLYFKKHGEKNANGKTIEYFPASFNQPPPNVIGRNVLICDFSYKKDITLKLIEESDGLLIIDHHKTAESELKDIPDQHKIFMMNHSGAYLTWKFFFPSDEVPLLIRYIEDNDIWLKQMPNTREVTSYIFALPFKFEEYEKLLDPDYITNTVIPVATGMNKQNTFYIDQAMSHATVKFTEINKKYYFIAHINSTILKSEIGNQLLSKHPNADFSAVYSMNNNTTYISLRSEDNRSDVSEIAKHYGGGGHRNASGITIYGSNEFGYVLDDYISHLMLNNIYIANNGVYLNVTHNKKQLGKYLLQTRFMENDKKVQQCCSILRNRHNNTDYVFCEYSCIWYYNGGNNCTVFLITCENDELYQTLKTKYENEQNYNVQDNDMQISFSRNGHLINC